MPPSSTTTASLSRRSRRVRCPARQFPYQGVRVTPNVYTAVDEVDTFVRAMTKLAKG